MVSPPGLLLALQPHMHYRGKSFRYEARYPDGRTETLLRVPAYDFNWQHKCEFAEPKWLLLGTRLTAIGVYDNSAANPDPKREVFFGLQSEEEMYHRILRGHLECAQARRAEKIAHCHRTPISYTGRMKYVLLSLCLALPIVATDKQAKPALKAKPRFELKLGGSLSKIAPASAFTIKLEFKLHGEEVETLLVLSSGGDYTINREHSGPNFEHSLQFDGSAASADGKKKSVHLRGCHHA